MPNDEMLEVCEKCGHNNLDHSFRAFITCLYEG